MSPELAKAFLVLFVGMVSVFTILGLVVLSGEVLILIINRYFPVASSQIKKLDSSGFSPAEPSTPLSPSTQKQKEHVAAIVAFVDHLTKGKGRVSTIEKIEESE